jgi:hypothetical protein
VSTRASPVAEANRALRPASVDGEILPTIGPAEPALSSSPSREQARDGTKGVANARCESRRGSNEHGPKGDTARLRLLVEGTWSRGMVPLFAEGAGKRDLGPMDLRRSTSQRATRPADDEGARAHVGQGTLTQTWGGPRAGGLGRTRPPGRAPLDIPRGWEDGSSRNVSAGRDKLQSSSGGAWRREARA